MIYPAQTSLIPVQIALARFLGSFDSFQSLRINVFGNYPYWYLGTTPYRYLTGPIIPSILVGLHKIFSFLSLFEIMLGLLGMVWVVGGIGVYLLIREMTRLRQGFGEARGIALIAAFFYIFGPVVPFLFRFSNGLYLIAFSILPFVMLVYYRWLKAEDGGWRARKIEILLCLSIAFVMLIDSLILPTLILGIAAIFLAQVGWKRAEEKIKKSLLLMAVSLLLATFWYTPDYWLTLLGAPSLAGKGLAGVIFQLGKLLPTVLAFGIAIFSVKFFKKKNLLRDFCFYWLFIFGFLTLLRFLSDPDFWMDWTAYSLELQFGVAIALGLGLSRIKANNNLMKANKRIVPLILCGMFFAQWLFMTNKYVLGTLQRDISQTVEYRVGRQLSEIAKDGDRVFLSGTTAFWFNAFFDIPQVRGGVDQVSVDQEWRKAVWEIREGTDPDKSLEWLQDLGISFLVVHTQESSEFYNDFKHPEKFEGVEELEKVYDEDGDRIYRFLQEEELNKKSD